MRKVILKKLISVLTSIGLFLSAAKEALAQPTSLGPTTISIRQPNVGYAELGTFINNVLRLIFGLAAIAVLLMLVWGALEWIFSGGEKDAVGKARNRILNALIGLAVLAVAFALAVVAGRFTGIDVFNIFIPTPTTRSP